jgi:hypothetical protein
MSFVTGPCTYQTGVVGVTRSSILNACAGVKMHPAAHFAQEPEFNRLRRAPPGESKNLVIWPFVAALSPTTGSAQPYPPFGASRTATAAFKGRSGRSKFRRAAR